MTQRPRVKIGVVGAGLMGREAATAIARWSALVDHPIVPELVAVCDINEAALTWFEQFDSVRLLTADYRKLLALDDLDVVYIAVRHDLHEEMYLAAIEAGVDLFAEKPFGIDLATARRITERINASKVFVRCSSEFPFFPGAQRIVDSVEAGDLGTIVGATFGFSHSSDLDQQKPINWKRQMRFCGEAGVMNDLGLHVAHVPLRLGWMPERLFAVLQDLVPMRPGRDGAPERCDTIDNASLLCHVETGEASFPMTLSTKRIDPGQMNTWEIAVIGLEESLSFSTRYPKTLRRMRLDRGEQVWGEVEMGSQGAFPTVTGGIFEFGFSDAVLQMWASFLAERQGELGERFGCATPEEAVLSHQLWSAALLSDGRTAVSP